MTIKTTNLCGAMHDDAHKPTSQKAEMEPKPTFNRRGIFFGGTVAPGYERMRILFEKQFLDQEEECGQLCVFVKGHRVLDLWGSLMDKDTGRQRYGYAPATVQIYFRPAKF
jgi:hypothetical protein